MKQRYIYNFNFFKIASILGFFFGFSMPFLLAQQDAQYTQYMYNTNTINPAYAGSQESITGTLLYRNQWAGLDGAPKTLNFTVHSQLGRKTGAGLSFTSDNIGPSKESTIAADFSYTIPIGEFSQVAFGLKGGINLLNVDYSLLTIFNPSDSQFQQNIDNRLSPLAGIGAFFYNSQYYVGLSVPNVLRTTHYDDITISNAQERPNLYFIAGYVFEINRLWLFKPAFLAKLLQGAPASIDLSANFLYDETFTIGAGYRYGSALSVLVGFQINKNILIGYGYDYDTSNLSNYSSGSHELFIRYSLGDKRDDKLLVPRFF